MFITLKSIKLKSATFGENYLRSASRASGAHKLSRKIVSGAPSPYNPIWLHYILTYSYY